MRMRSLCWLPPSRVGAACARRGRAAGSLDTAALLATTTGSSRTSSTCRSAAGTASSISTCRAARAIALPTALLFHGGGWVTRQQGRDRARRAPLPGDGVRGRRTSTTGWRASRARPRPCRTAAARSAGSSATRPQYGFDADAAGAGRQLGGGAPRAHGGAGARLGRLRRALSRRRAAQGGGGDQLLRRHRRRRAAGAADRARLRGRLDGRPARIATALARSGSRPSPTSRKGAPPSSRCTATPIRWCRSRRRTRLHAALDRAGVPNRSGSDPRRPPRRLRRRRGPARQPRRARLPAQARHRRRRQSELVRAAAGRSPRGEAIAGVGRDRLGRRWTSKLLRRPTRASATCCRVGTASSPRSRRARWGSSIGGSASSWGGRWR